MMTFHESYGELPMRTLRLIKRYNVSPADFDLLLYKFGEVDTHFADIDNFITIHSAGGYYNPPRYL